MATIKQCAKNPAEPVPKQNVWLGKTPDFQDPANWLLNRVPEDVHELAAALNAASVLKPPSELVERRPEPTPALRTAIGLLRTIEVNNAALTERFDRLREFLVGLTARVIVLEENEEMRRARDECEPDPTVTAPKMKNKRRSP